MSNVNDSEWEALMHIICSLQATIRRNNITFAHYGKSHLRLRRKNDKIVEDAMSALEHLAAKRESNSIEDGSANG